MSFEYIAMRKDVAAVVKRLPWEDVRWCPTDNGNAVHFRLSVHAHVPFSRIVDLRPALAADVVANGFRRAVGIKAETDKDTSSIERLIAMGCELRFINRGPRGGVVVEVLSPQFKAFTVSGDSLAEAVDEIYAELRGDTDAR